MRKGIRVAVLLAVSACVHPANEASGAGALPSASGPSNTPSARPSVAETLRQEALAKSRAHEWVQQLTDRVGPRLAGSPGDAKAVAWAVEKMKELGLSKVRAEKVPFTRWERGVETGAVVSPVQQPLLLTALGGSVPTRPEGVEAEVIEVASVDALDALPADGAKGKIVFITLPTERGNTAAGYAKAAVGRHRGASAAAKKGAVAMILRSLGTSNARFPHAGSMGYEEGVPQIPAAALSVPDALLLQRLLAAGGPVRVKLVLGCRTVGPAETANVVGEIPGRERPDEIVLIGAHLDSWDLGTGALDDGAGVGAVLDAARLIAAAPSHPRRTVRVVLFANEEHGLDGAMGYAQAHASELAHHVVAMELDHGTEKVLGVSFVGGPETERAMKEIGALLAPLQVEAPAPGPGHGADLTPLRTPGVPLVALHQDSTPYFDYHHTADDTFDKIDAAKLAQVVAATVAFTYGAADSTADFGRIPAEMRERPRR